MRDVTKGLETAMKEAVSRSHDAMVAKLKQRIDIEAQRAVREAWAEEIAEMARELVRERFNTLELRTSILAALSALITEQAITAAIHKSLNGTMGQRSWEFDRLIDAAVSNSVQDAVSADAEGTA